MGDALLRAGGLIVATAATIVTAVAEIYLVPLRAGPVHLGAAVLVAAVVNWVLAWFVVVTTGRRWSAGVPWVLWTVVMLVASGASTPEGDHLIKGSDDPFADGAWVAPLMILGGSLSFAVFACRSIMSPAPR
jgi:hypothetical protein